MPKTTPARNHFNTMALFVSFVVLSFALSCQTPAAPETLASDEATLKKLDDEWSRAAGAKDVEKTASYYSDDAAVLPPNSPVLMGKEAARNMWKTMMAAPGFGGGWKSTKVEVSKSGDLAYIYGTYEMSENDASGKPMTDKGKYLEVWKKQADGNWKCVADMFSSDLPPAAPPTTKATSGESR